MNVVSLTLGAIEVPQDRARDLDPAWAEALAAVIAAQGLQHPIRVRRIGTPGESYRLVSGLHRLEAARLLGWDRIEATLSGADSDDAARLEEVMENLGRHELIALDRCHHLHELKQVWERLYPETKHGGERPGAGRKVSRNDKVMSQTIKTQTLRLDSNSSEIFGFARANAEKIGLSKRSIELAVRIWIGLSPASRARLAGTDLAAKQTELVALSELKAPRQAQVLDLLLGETLLPGVGNVAQALEYLATGLAPDMHERKFLSVTRTIAALDDLMLDAVLAAHEARVLASLKRRGVI